MTDPSSITSVTEEDDSNESDTTETSNSKASDGVSSFMYSSECNTDDKLTPSLVRISISSSSSKKRQRQSEETIDRNNQNWDETDTTSPPFPYGCNPLPLKGAHKIVQVKKKLKKSPQSTPLTKYVFRKNFDRRNGSYLPKQEEENFGVDDPDNYLYTDFSDTSSIPWPGNEDDDIESVNDEDEPSESCDCRPFLPDMRTDSWFQAKCFDRYWSHYSFVMEWYRQHLHAVNMLSVASYCGTLTQASQPLPKKRSRSKRSKKRARSRRLAKAKHRAAKEQLLTEELINETSTAQDPDSVGDNDEIQMEITEDMMDFFATSFKHRMDRDSKKKGEDDGSDVKEDGIGIGSGKGFIEAQGFGLVGPSEQPGARRAAEMKVLYGAGAPMIHGMETALQMTYDKMVDRHQPKLWPNVPLKIVFN